MKNYYVTVALVVSWQNTSLVNIGAQVKVLFVAEIFFLINAHKIRMVEREVKKWGKKMVQIGLKMFVLTKGCNITHFVGKNNIFEVCQFGMLGTL